MFGLILIFFVYFLKIISGAGHHVYADKPEIFNRYVNEACNLTDSSEDRTVAVIKNKNGLFKYLNY